MTPSVGDVIDERYRVDRVLGDANSRLFEAYDFGAERRVVFKFLHPTSTGTAAGRARLQRELQIAANLRDPHTVRVFGHGEHGNVPYIIFEYVPGEDLSALIERGPWSPQIGRRVLLQLLSALKEAHQAGIVHRDVRPANIRVFEHLSEAWNIKLVDFGLGRTVNPAGDHVAVTATGELLGVPRYLPPEAIRGEPAAATGDLYSVALIVLEVILGPDALGGGAGPPSPATLQSAIDRTPEDLGRVLRRMLAPDAGRRYASADAVVAALQTPDSVSAPQALSTVRPAAAKDDRPRWWWLIIGGIGLLVAGAWFVGGERHAETSTPVVPGVSSRGSALIHQPSPGVFDAGRPPTVTMVAPANPMHGCGQEPPFTGTSELSVLDDAALVRTSWLTTVPADYDLEHRYPIVVLLHGFQQSAADLLHKSGFSKLADEKRFIVIAPEDDSLMKPWKDGAADIARVHFFLTETKRRLCVDDTRVFVVGHSQGGHLLDKMICEHWIAAGAFHSHRGSDFGARCPSREVPLIIMNPKRSADIPFKGGLNCAGQTKESVAAVEKKVRRRNGCESRPEVVFSDPTGRCFGWSCRTPFVSCHIEGGHAWPGVPAIPSCPSVEPAPFPVADRIWNFFASIPES